MQLKNLEVAENQGPGRGHNRLDHGRLDQDHQDPHHVEETDGVLNHQLLDVPNHQLLDQEI